jgi:hypothetical protein
MKVYRIKIDDLFYVKGIVFDSEGIQVIPTWEITKAGWYEEDKAKKYCEELNKKLDFHEAGIKFDLEFVKEVE